ncbi:MAG: outer membrane protein [Alphaproteobacteria bacterium]
MNKKIFQYALLVCTLAASASFAETAPTPTSEIPQSNVASKAPDFSGFYLGGGVGYSSQKASGNFKTSTHQGNSNLTPKGFKGGVFVGYGHTLGSTPIYLGLEVGYTFGQSKEKVSGNIGGTGALVLASFELKNKGGLEGAARLGIAFKNVMPYIKVGVAQCKRSWDLTVNGSPRKKNEKFTALSLGLGFNTMVSRNIMIGLDYTYINYPKKEYTSGANTLKINQKENRICATLAYKF